MASIKLKGDVSGEITIQAPAVAGTTTLNLPATSSTLATQNALGVRNLIINGDMRIDQRNAGASVTPSNQAYGLDRWKNELTQASKFSIQQVTDAPQGAINSLKITSLSAYSVISTDQFNIGNYIEGKMISHLDWGSSNAKTVTLSFWVKSSLTGTFSGALNNASGNRSYVFEYTILSANTWEQKSITIAGETTGTWLTDNGVGIRVCFSLGCGSTITGTANTWTGSFLQQATGATSLLATNGATLQLSLVQLEVGDTATPFEHRPYDMEFQRCIRYFRTVGDGIIGRAISATNIYFSHHFETPMRTIPAMSLATTSIRFGNLYSYDVTSSGATVGLPRCSVNAVVGWVTGFSGITVADMMQAWQNNPAGWLKCDAEL